MGSEQKRAFIAVIISGVILFTWQMYFAPKPIIEKKVVTKVVQNSEQQVSNNKIKTEIEPIGSEALKEVSKVEIKSYDLVRGGHELSIRNDLAVSNIKGPNTKFTFQDIGGNKLPFKVQLLLNGQAQNLVFDLQKTSDTSLKGEDSRFGIKFGLELKEDGKINFSFNSEKPSRYRFLFDSKKEQLVSNQIRDFLVFSKEVERYEVGSSEVKEENIKWFGIDFNFHVINFIFPNKVMSKYRMQESGMITIDTINPINYFSGDLLFVEKNYDHLLALGDKQHLAVDFGVFGIIAVPILRGLQFFYKYIPNYGVAIIFLTLLIRMLTFPLQYKSFKSMKKMQVLQPELTKLKEKFKDDPQRMQKETMALFKRAGANPLGGCLPLILQMPIFFAFYKVLYEAVELVEAPFMIWIHDLSQKDPYYVLPVLMAISMLLQQKFTPSTTTDDTQKKIMMFMPVVFGFIMKDLPSGLVLYIFVSTLFGILQQMFVYKTVD
jgi:YidC/Oxa1 family membrane protein insertase